MPKGIRGIKSAMCNDGWYANSAGYDYVKSTKAKPNPLNCVECESTCQGGMLYLELMPEEEFQALLCGGD